MAVETTTCPGCGVEMARGGASYDRKFHASAECWGVFEEVIAREFQDAVLFGRVHQMTVDAYAVQHAGGRHPDKSVCIHFVGLYLVLERGVAPVAVSPLHQRLAERMRGASWPHLEPPAERAALTVHYVAVAKSPQEHARRVREWAAEVWRIWGPHHGLARELGEGLAGDAKRVAKRGVAS